VAFTNRLLVQSLGGDPVQSDGQTPRSESAQSVRDHVRHRFQALSEHLRAQRQTAEAGIIRAEGDDPGSLQEAAAGDQGSATIEESSAQPRVLVLQRELLPDLPLVASLARAGLDVIGPFNRVSQARTWIESNRPAAAVLDIALWDGTSFDLAGEFQRREVPFLFYTSWDDPEAIPLELREMPFLEKPIHFALVARLLSKMVAGGQVTEIERGDDQNFTEEQ
jgi:hypothetical protein